MGAAAGTVLYASYVSPFPPHSGERIRALNLISALSTLGYEVEAIVGNYENVDLPANNGRGVRFHQIPFAWPRLRQATGVYFRSHPGFVAQVRALHAQNPLAAIVLDYGFVGAQIGPLSQLGIPIILGTHNLESSVTGQVVKGSLAAKAAVRLRQAVEFAHERLFFSRADAVLCVSEEDRRAYARFLNPKRLHLVPNFVDIADIYRDFARENRIIMTGSFDNFQNRHGLRWFVDEVWNETLRGRTQLCVAGKQSDRAVAELGNVPGIVGLGVRSDLLAELARSRAAIVPLWHGGGTRLKCIEAMATRTPVITTPKGCEGITHAGAFRVADNAASFRTAVLCVLDNPVEAAQNAARARSIFDTEYSRQANVARLTAALEAAKRVASQRAKRRARLHATIAQTG